MTDPTESLGEVKLIMYEILATLYNHGIDTVSVGAIMRLLGVPNEVASQHDDDVIVVTAEVGEYMEETINSKSQDLKIPPGTTIH
jgi:hypothetical protein